MKKTVVESLRGVCGTAALASTETKSPGSAGRDLPHNPRRGNGLGLAQPHYAFHGVQTRGTRGVPTTDLVCCRRTPFGNREVH